MTKLKMTIAVLTCFGFCVANLHAESQKPSENSSTKKHEEIVPEQSQAEEQFNQAECFDKIWESINDKFWDPNFNGVDWEDAGKRYRPKALAAEDHESFAIIINQMLAELKTSHNHYYTKWEPNYYTLQAALISDFLAVMKTSDTSDIEKSIPGRYSSRANPHRTGIGVVTKKIDDDYYVNAVLASSPAEKAGIAIGDWLLQVNGHPFHPISSFENKAGQEVELTIQRGPSESTRHMVTAIPLDTKERELFEIDTQARMKTIEHKGHHFSYIRLWWLGGRVMRKALDWGVNDADKVEGIIIDIRHGFGAGPADEYMKPFVKNSSETVAHKEIGRTKTFHSTVKFEKTGKFEKPVIIIISGGTRSAKEVLVYYFRKTKRGVLIGERTAGFVSGGGLERISGDSLLLYCKWMKVIDSKHLEGVGVEPDIEVPFDIRFAAGKDIQLERAKDEMVKLIEAAAASSGLGSQLKSNAVLSLGSLQTRNGIIRLESDGKFSILDLSGNPIALFLNKAEFQKGYPRLYKDFETAIANIESGDIILDASMGTDHTQLELLR
ncbi:MAG: S41 family peptidase [Planctomycetota bacterium]|jgi:carboxyl-terminal processing protease